MSGPHVVDLEGYSVRLGSEDAPLAPLIRVRDEFQARLRGIPITLDVGPHPDGLPFSIDAVTMAPQPRHIDLIRNLLLELLGRNAAQAESRPHS